MFFFKGNLNSKHPGVGVDGAGLLVKMRGKLRILVAKLMKRQTSFNNFHTIAPILCGPIGSDTIRYVFL